MSESNSSPSKSDVNVPLTKKRKKGVYNTCKYRPNQIKKSRLTGKLYKNYKGTEIQGKIMGDNCG